MSKPVFEVCVELDGAAAEQGGADRVELCASLVEGGLTPSHGVIRMARATSAIPVHVMVRPRGGDFAYARSELEAMQDDIRHAKDMQVAAVVFGCLTLDGDVDEAATRELVALARPLGVTFHRAFDMTRDPHAALDALVRCGVDRVLTSGQQPTAVQGAPLLRRLGEQAAGRIIVMGCGELDAGCIGAVRRETGLIEFHFAALRPRPSPMRWRNPAIAMGGTAPDREYTRVVTDAEAVRATIAAATA